MPLPEVEELIALQDLDRRIATLEAATRAIPPLVQEFESRLHASRGAHEAARGAHVELEKTRRLKEGELKQVEQQAKEKQVRLWEIRKNEEYSAVLKEIELLKAKQSALEEGILLLFDQIEEAARTVATREGDFREREAEFVRQRGAKGAELTRLQQEVAEFTKQRGGRARRIEAGLLQSYTRLLKSRGGLAVVPVKDGSCSGCFVALTPQAHTEVRKAEVLMTCANCQRILYWKG
ncbi:MAG: C4-type zinc ribbon domain-containing protein [candidate division NC10 bacterium]|nr:C4-type zinc ribbon domain-containing protein [candidate division NC10 bacterium]